ncbi:tRNA (guanine(46)-N(7))-methyltransferase TrmB [Terrarubrum flagellatum]|uniref:tRNA (guanine(46)-N(7))-methyltransferase TrmB n=1 Tax=Terrirubrum flagellatum TaxID=2895980 RepID=UPI003144D6DA
MSDARRHDDGRAFFGRRVSHKLRGGREATLAALMPKLRVALGDGAIEPSSLFDVGVKEAWLEIGFGGGEHLIARALENPDVGFIGCEAYIDGVARLVGEIEKNALGNVRLYDADAIRLIDRLPDASIARVYLLYPDPWPKRRQRKRRFVSDERLAALARILKPGGEFRFATDIDDYAAWTLARALRSPDFEWVAEGSSDWLTPWPNWASTRYEKKALREGRTGSYLTFRRV